MVERRWPKWLGALVLGLSVLFGAKPALADSPSLETQEVTEEPLRAERHAQSAATGPRDDLDVAERAMMLAQRELGPDHRLVADTLSDLARVYDEKGDRANAEKHYLQALQILETTLGPEHPDVATSLNTLAVLYEEKGDYAAAEKLYLRALLIREKRLKPDHPALAISLNNLAGLYLSKGHYAEAEKLYQRALDIWTKAHGPEHPRVAAALTNLAVLSSATGDYARAEPYLKSALAILEKAFGPEHAQVAFPLATLGGLYRAKGDYRRAEVLCLRALSIREKALGPGHPAVATSLDSLAMLYDTKKDYARAEPLARRALSIREKALGSEHPAVAQSLDILARLHLHKGNYAQAEPLLRRALSIREAALGMEHRSVAELLQNLARLYLHRGDYAQAEPLLRRALFISDKVLGPEHPTMASLLKDVAWRCLAMGDIPCAMQRMKGATAIEDGNADRLLGTGSDEQKRAYMGTLRDTTDLNISAHVQFGPSSPGAMQLALTTILRRKGVALDAMADSFAALRHRRSPEDLAQFDEYQHKSAAYSNAFYRGPGTMPPDEFRAILDQHEEERQDTEDRLSRSVEVKAAMGRVALDQVRAAIPEGAALVELFRYRPFIPKASFLADRWGKPRYVAYALRRRDAASFIDLGEAAKVDAAVRNVQLAFSDPDLTHDPRSAARTLDSLLMQPIRSQLGDTRWLFLSPDGPLNLVPFAALVDEDGRYLVERYLITYLASGRDLLRFQACAEPKQNALVLANPAFSSADLRVSGDGRHTHRGLRSVDMSQIQFSPLAGTAEEARVIHRRLGGALLLGLQATEGAVKAAHGPRILHIATHGFFLGPQATEEDVAAAARLAQYPLHRENPLLRSGLGLAGANTRASGANDDGILTALEVSALDLVGTKLVVLSACETGVGEASSGEGVYGLRRALTVAGAETQVMSLWKVDSGVTREMMAAYYDKLANRAGRSEAMREVQLEMLARDDRAHPNLWASFIVSGNAAALDGTAVMPKVSRGLRGCACAVAGYHGPPTGAAVDARWLAGLAMLVAAGRSGRRARPRIRA